MVDAWHECFITDSYEYCLLDGNMHLRATATSLKGILKAQEYFKWGTIHTLKYDLRGVIIIGDEVK